MIQKKICLMGAYAFGKTSLVADGTRRHSLERAVALPQRIREKIGPVPFLLRINKADLEAAFLSLAASLLPAP